MLSSLSRIHRAIASRLWYDKIMVSIAKTKTPVKSKKKSIVKHTFRSRVRESDGQYLLKLVVVVLIGAVWFKFGHVFYFGPFAVTGIPLGMLLGILLVDKLEVHQDDRKIWYAILILVAIASYFLPAGIVL